MIFGERGEGGGALRNLLNFRLLRGGLYFYMFPPKAIGSHGQKVVGMANLGIRLC